MSLTDYIHNHTTQILLKNNIQKRLQTLYGHLTADQIGSAILVCLPEASEIVAQEVMTWQTSRQNYTECVKEICNRCIKMCKPKLDSIEINNVFVPRNIVSKEETIY